MGETTGNEGRNQGGTIRSVETNHSWKRLTVQDENMLRRETQQPRKASESVSQATGRVLKFLMGQTTLGNRVQAGVSPVDYTTTEGSSGVS